MEQQSIKHQVFMGAKWQGLFRLSFKALSFVKLFIIARILAPNDYGIYGVASLVIAGFEVLTRTGFDDALIHKRGRIEQYLHTSFWIQVLRGVILFVLIFFSSEYVANFFASPDSKNIIRLLAFSQLLIGFRSIGLTLLIRDLKFTEEIKYQFITTILEITTTIVLVLIFKNVLVLAIGAVIGEVLRTAYSYFVHPYRPKLHFDWAKARELYNFGIWLLLTGVLGYISLQGDNILVGKLAGIAALGIYQVAFNLSNLPTTEVVKPLSKILKPAYANLQDDKPKLEASISKSFSLLMGILLPLTVFFACNAELITYFALGNKWSAVIPYISILTIGGLFRAITTTFSSFFIGVGQTRFLFKAEVVRAGSLVLFMVLFYHFWGPIGIAYAVCISTFSSLVMIFNGIQAYLGSLDFLLKFTKPILLSIFLAAVLYYLSNQAPWNYYLKGIAAGIIFTVSVISIGIFEKRLFKDEYLFKTSKELLKHLSFSKKPTGRA